MSQRMLIVKLHVERCAIELEIQRLRSELLAKDARK
jgi:hypothetical protein